MDSSNELDVVGLGASTLDVITLVDHFPTRREVQEAHSTIIQGGGPASTAMVTVCRLGGRAAMIDSIGDDWAGKYILKEFEMEGVKTETIEVQCGHTSAISNILVRQADGARAIMFLPGSAPEPVLSTTQRDAIKSAKILHLTGRYWGCCMEAIELAKKEKVRVSFDGGADRFKPEMKNLVPLTDICITAHDFAWKYTGEDDPCDAVQRLVAEGVEIAVVTHGVHGSWVRTREGINFHQPAFLFPKVTDTTGCGDSYHGAFLAALVKGFSIRNAATIASAAAGLNSQKLGGRKGLPILPEILKFLWERGVYLDQEFD